MHISSYKHPSYPALPAHVSPIFGISRSSAYALRFAENTSTETELSTEIELLTKAAIRHFPGIDKSTLEKSVQTQKPIKLADGTEVLYGVLHTKGVSSPFPRIKKLAEAAQNGVTISAPQPFFIQTRSPQIDSALKQIIEELLPQHLKATHYNPSTKVESPSVIYTEVIEKLLKGQADQLTPDLKTALDQAFSPSGSTNKKLHAQQSQAKTKTLPQLYKLTVPGKPELEASLNQNSANFRKQLLGLELARKIYAEGQEVEWHSIALSLAMGGISEPTVSHMFQEGGPVASTIRTVLLSGVDIMGNVLSVMGVVSEKQKAKNQKLSMDTIFGPKGKRSFINPQGSAGPDVKQGIKTGVGGGLFGVLYNIPVGMLLSQPNGDILSRAVVGGLSSTGSAVAIPKVIKDSQKAFTENIKTLIADGKILMPNPDDKNDAAKVQTFAEKMARKEMNTRIGYATSIKATHPVPLVGLGAIILGAEKLGIPRQYVQTAYMSLAPVMHNFIRLLYTGLEKYYTIPHRMKKLEKIVLEGDQKSDEQKQKALDKAMLDGTWMTKLLTNTTGVIFAGVTLLAAELLVFNQAYRRNKTDLESNSSKKPQTPSINFQLQPQIVQAQPNPLSNGPNFLLAPRPLINYGWPPANAQTWLPPQPLPWTNNYPPATSTFPLQAPIYSVPNILPFE